MLRGRTRNQVKIILQNPSFIVAGILVLCAAAQSCAADSADAEGSTDAAEANPTAPVQLAQYPSAPFEDRHGVLWISTVLQGLIRYDGKEFVNLTTKDGLASNGIRSILEDKDGGLLLATTAGVSKYDGKVFTSLTEYANGADLRGGPGFSGKGFHRDVWDIQFVRGGELWITTLDGVFRQVDGKFERYPIPALDTVHDYQFTPNMVYSVYEDPQNVLWFCTDGMGLIRDDGKTQVVYTTKDGLCSNYVCTVVQDRRGDFWIGSSDGGVSRYDGKSFTTHLRNKEFSESMGWGRFMAVHLDAAGNVWFGAAGPVRGAYRFDGKEFRLFSKQDGLGDGHIPSISEDRAGGIWFGTTAGVYRFDGTAFTNLTRKP